MGQNMTPPVVGALYILIVGGAFAGVIPAIIGHQWRQWKARRRDT
ncbi:MAG TPA: hypothetical protein VFH56_14205 [Acidimicrobiales bacterium]|nr:hypothetical protein [Acidimicrobiales bacterium]